MDGQTLIHRTLPVKDRGPISSSTCKRDKLLKKKKNEKSGLDTGKDHGKTVSSENPIKEKEILFKKKLKRMLTILRNYQEFLSS